MQLGTQTSSCGVGCFAEVKIRARLFVAFGLARLAEDVPAQSQFPAAVTAKASLSLCHDCEIVLINHQRQFAPFNFIFGANRELKMP